MKAILADKLKVRIYEVREELGADAAKLAAKQIKSLLEKQEFVNIIFAAASSQNEFLAALNKENIEWQRVNGFHMDEYIGLPEGAPQLFRNFLNQKIFTKQPFHSVNYLNGCATDIPAECERYTELLKKYPVDITCMGIGENAHLAFNDPHVADFADPADVKIVDLDEACKQQQVNEGCFPAVKDVPNDALTLTIPALLKAPFILCMVPGATKAQAVYHTLADEISEQYPSTILRTHPETHLFLEKNSASQIGDFVNQLQENNHS
jgi:glucosamine-6-phosphate deaminase